MALRTCLRRSVRAYCLLKSPHEPSQSNALSSAVCRCQGVEESHRTSSVPSGGQLTPYSTIEAAQTKIDEVNDLFTEARELIEDAQDEAETVYFNEAHQEAKDAVNDVLARYHGVLESLSEGEKGKLQRSMGLKIEQLKAELGNLDLLHA